MYNKDNRMDKVAAMQYVAHLAQDLGFEVARSQELEIEIKDLKKKVKSLDEMLKDAKGVIFELEQERDSYRRMYEELNEFTRKEDNIEFDEEFK